MRGDHSKHIVLKLISTDLLFTKFAATSLCDTFIAYNGTYFLLTVPQKVCWNRYRFHCEPTSYLTQQSSRENCRFLESPDIEMGLYCLATRYCLPDILGVSAGILTTARVGIDQIRTQWNCAFLTIPLWGALEWISLDQNSDQIWTKFSGVWLRANHHKIYCSCRFCTKQYFLLIIHKTGSQGSGMQQLGKIGKIEDGSTHERLLISESIGEV